VSEGPPVELIDPATLRAWIDSGEAYVVDVREPHEYAMAHIAGTALMPLSRFDPGAVRPPEGKKLVIHCASGVRCGVATRHLLAAGYRGKVHRLAGGIEAWYHEGLPIARG